MNSTTTCETIGSSTVCTSTGAMYVGGFSYGEMVIATLLLALLLISFFGGIVNQIAGVKVRAIKWKSL